MKQVFTLLLALLWLQWCGCRPKCSTPSLYGRFSGYDSAELAYVIVRQYEHATQFSKLVSTSVGGTAVTTTVPGTDTIYMGPYQYLYFYPKPDYDYTIEIPATGQLFKLRDFSVGVRRSQYVNFGEAEPCSNTVNYTLDDKQYSDRASPDGSRLRPVFIELKR